MQKPSPSNARVETLENGLMVFLREKHEAPVASFWVWYRVGSRNELPGLTGTSHWVEHMQFKGTPSLAKGAIFGEVSRNGGTLNAMTSTDWTAYYETLPASQLDLSLRIESDRMTNSLFDPEETESERTVILSERQGAENRPTYHLTEEMIGTAFQAHPYRHMVIGYENDLRSISRDDLYSHYRRYYAPNNAFISAVGDFDAEELMEGIRSAFGSIERGHDSLPPVAQEPPQRGERRVLLKRPSPASYLMMGYRMPGAKHPDIPALLVADALLSGAKPMGMGGGSAMGRSSRLYRGLVSSGLARSAGSGANLHIDPHLWTFSATALPGIEPERIEEAIEAEIDRLKTNLATDEEFLKARKQIRAQYVYSRETVTAEAFWQGQMEIIDHAGRVDTLADELAAVTPDDVQRVVQTWLVDDQRTVGWQVPDDATTMAGADVPPLVEAAGFRSPDPQLVWGLDGGTPSEHGFVRTELANGIVVLAQPRPGDEAVEASISIAAGQSATGESTPGLPSITAKMLNRGTRSRTFEQFNEAIDGLGAVISVDADRDDVEVSFHSLAEDLEAVFSLAAEVILEPVFPGDELEKVKQQAITGLREQEMDTGSMASRALREQLYPEGHPYRIPVSGEIDSVSALTSDDLSAYHKRSFGPNVTTIALVGGVENLDAVVTQVERVFGSWITPVPVTRDVPPIDPPASTARKSYVIRGKSQADIAIGYPSLPRSLDRAYFAVNMANVILGQLGLMGRLGANVRDKQGFAYYASSSFNGGTANSVWSARAGVDPGNIQRAL
ncbi:MAG: insulinase family protein, partial [Chloroflexota bacterium]|nr:insulinase family protein [Chloroflexota bacterium]